MVDKMLEVRSPFDNSLIQEVELDGFDDVEKKLKRAYEIFRGRDAWIEVDRRIEILIRLAELVGKEQDEFAALIALEGGKPLMDAKVEVARAIDGIFLAIDEIRKLEKGDVVEMGRTKASEGREAVIEYEPIGVVVAVSAFNHPLNLIVHQVIPAVAVGASVIVKPASATPLNCLRLVELLYEAGLPKDYCRVVVCSNDVAEKLVTDKRIAFFSFIGSAKVGWWLRSKLSPGVRCALEHGGVAPVIIDEGMDFDKVIPLIAKGGFYHAGQVCVSVQRVYVKKGEAVEFANRLAEVAGELVVGDATKEETEVGPLILHREVDRVEEWVNEAVNGGGKLIVGGKRIGDSLFEPTVILNPSEDAQVSKEEVFGPVVCVYEYEDYREAIDRANSLDVAFQAAVFSNRQNMIDDCVKYFDATAVMVNDHTAFRVDWMPFAGRRCSGYGVGGIGYTMEDMVQIKMRVVNASF